jgi:membrane protein DedA with SNARE-associated domain
LFDSGIHWYFVIFFSAAIEGEVVYSAAVIAAHLGHLNPLGVFISGALGGSAGDQCYFYILRSRVAHWLDRFEAIHRRRRQIEVRVREHSTAMVLASRFLPGLRVAIPAACAFADIRPFRFSTLSLISGLAWAGAIMAVIMTLGPSSMKQLGVDAWWAPAIPAVFVILFFRWLTKPEKKTD